MSRFVAAGTDSDYQPPVQDDGWEKAQKDVESLRNRKKTDEGKQEGGKSLYEVLQANKAAKQEAFEESARLKNQFRALDEDEVDFLDSVLESSRAKEEAVKLETAEQLEAFRKNRAAAEQAEIEGNNDGQAAALADGSSWSMKKKKKRRRDKENEPEGDMKLRKLSSADDHKSAAHTSPVSSAAVKLEPALTKQDDSHEDAPNKALPNKTPAALGLAGYSSDEEEW